MSKEKEILRIVNETFNILKGISDDLAIQNKILLLQNEMYEQLLQLEEDDTSITLTKPLASYPYRVEPYAPDWHKENPEWIKTYKNDEWWKYPAASKSPASASDKQISRYMRTNDGTPAEFITTHMSTKNK